MDRKALKLDFRSQVLYPESVKNLILFLSMLSVLIIPKNSESRGGSSIIPFYIYNAATTFKIDAALLYSICQVESNCKSGAINHDDATANRKAAGVVEKSYGLFQIKKGTAKQLGFVTSQVTYIDKVRHGHRVKVRVYTDFTNDLLKPEVNAYYAAKLIRRLYDKYGDTLKVLSAYNAGRPIKGNKEYVNKVLRKFARYKIDKGL